ncbi:DUF1304 domain-containing protein [Paenibacillus massiliensis]|uniref:DUF1304 domain-containing protein n=1 Tax=Paenibacillus massiliensis TaxID=225917 RepID=UPI0003607E6A|nr:DUF1304 domain-containing protein [Paenibacillus massiliensis]
MLGAIFVGLVAALHVYIFLLETFFWTTPRARKAFATTPEFAAQTKTLAANQGVYNAFLAAGLIWGLAHPVASTGQQIQVFFLLCVLVAGLFGGLTSKRSILFVQAMPALITLLLVWLT